MEQNNIEERSNHMSFDCLKPKEAISLIWPWSRPIVRGLETTYYTHVTLS